MQSGKWPEFGTSDEEWAKIREEAFLDVSLDVEAEDGTVEGALQRYLEPEILDGENRWASPAGRCAARP